MSNRLKDKVAIVTGAASGMGAAMVGRFAAEGAMVIAADISDTIEDVANRVEGQCLSIQVDVSSAADVRKMIALAKDKFGRLDVLCNNAGIQGPLAPTAEYDDDEWERVIAINLTGVYLGMKHAIPVMLETGGGSIINTSSMASIVAFPSLPAYSASKGGVSILTRLTAAEYASQGIRVNAIAPGAIDTGMTRNMPQDYLQGAIDATLMGRIGTPEEIASLALFLASDEASFITGTETAVDGGYTLV
ncbi:glucose 1-dehydrogenase [Altererythrobacter sp. SALINAS58]|uniref:SDR family NAD(P)-dependent oxidoreductase n=1 Tax=Alteripontixanthobacter muriae TaxID=2705546 RepID=UPI001575009A|nr:glucose 1-dehydrogenase [Alteripontixanthobacter muriae]NTZ43809.1 glucose 1-dehydrogenase [Alteripontixanthobacter muriae]